MSTSIQGFALLINRDQTCWAGASSVFELKLQQPLPSYALEQLRTRFMHAVTTTHAPVASARAVFQMAYETEIGTALIKVVDIPQDAQVAVVCERRSYIDIDADMQQFSFLLNPAMEAALALGYLPKEYVALFDTHIRSKYAKYRMCGIAAFLCMTAQYLV